MRGANLTIVWCVLTSLNVRSQAAIGSPGDENWENGCGQMANVVSEANKNTRALAPPPIPGKWVSERCESRSGPRFLLRSYSFYPNNTFQLIQFYYNDESCSSVSYTVAIDGSYKMRSRGSTSFAATSKLVYSLRKVAIVAHDYHTATNLSSTLHERCPGQTDRYWKPFVEYAILWKSEKGEREKCSQRSPAASCRCLAAINLSLDELNVVRIQSRHTFANQLKYELLLANAYQYADHHRQTMRQKFQLPLVLADRTHDCLICDTVARSTNMFVAPLPAKPRLPLLADGEWISDRCEGQSTGLFSRRALRMAQRVRRWQLQTSYYADDACAVPMMVHRVVGSYVEYGAASKWVAGAVDVDFSADKSYLTVVNQSVLQAIRSDPFCGIPHYWHLGVTSEIPSRTGCASVGISNPSVNFNIARLDLDEQHGTYLLYLGDEGSTSGADGRPTAYRYPLLRCSAHVDDSASVSDATSRSSFCAFAFAFAFAFASTLHAVVVVLR